MLGAISEKQFKDIENELKQSAPEINKEMKELAEIVPELAKSITDQETVEMAANELAKWKSVKKKIVDWWEPSKDSAAKTHKLIVAQEKEMLAVVERNMVALNIGISNYLLEQRKKEEEERRRVELENIAKAEAEKKALKEEADKALEAGKMDVAEALEEQANLVYVEPVVLPPAAPKKIELEGGGSQSSRDDCDIEITDEKTFITAVLAHILNIPFSVIKVSLNVTPTKSWIKSEKIKTFPGLKITPKMTISTRGK